MKKQWLVNLYNRGQARVSDRDNLDDDAERKKFDKWWKSSAHKYKAKHPDAYENFETFYNTDDKGSRTYDKTECKKVSKHKHTIILSNKSRKSLPNMTTVPAHLFPST